MTEILILPDREARPSIAPVHDNGVALIHGLGRSTGSMLLLGRRLARAGFLVWRIGYPSRRMNVADAAERIAAALAPLASRLGRLHLVGHSFGGVIARRIASAGLIPVGRVVQIGAPNRGSRTAARLIRLLPLGWCLGPAASELSEPRPPIPRRRGVAAIAGFGQRHLPGVLLGASGSGDGLVSVRSAWAGAEARGAVDCGHTLLPLSRRVAEMTAEFLARGRLGPTSRGGACPRPS